MLKFLLATTLLFATVYGGVVVPKLLPLPKHITEDRIVGGEDADIADAPYQAAMLMGIGIHTLSCGGSIISENVIVCAAHCRSGTLASMWRVRVGSTYHLTGGQVLEVTRTIGHPNYNSGTIDFDISLFILSSPIELDGVTTRPIPLPAQDASVVDGASALVTGWGSTREGGLVVNHLQKVTIPVVNQEVCAEAYDGVNTITPRMICAGLLETGGQDACQGDSGGPLAVDGVLIGITSWGVGCARAGYPGVWGRVPAFRDWIDEQLTHL